MPKKKDREFELRRLYREWGDGESGLPIVKLLLEMGREDEAATFARGMLAHAEWMGSSAAFFRGGSESREMALHHSLRSG